VDGQPDISSCSSKTNTQKTSMSERVPLLQHLLAISHKYEVTRLHLWCEQELSKYLSVTEVCHVLCQAHLYEAAQLEKTCLSWIKANQSAVVVTPAFSALAKEWPEVMFKVSMFLSGITGAEASRLLEAHWKSHTCSIEDQESGETKHKLCDGVLRDQESSENKRTLSITDEGQESSETKRQRCDGANGS